jgi:MFS family permease
VTPADAASPLRPTGKLSREEAAVLTKLFVPQVIIGMGAGALVPFLNVFFKVRFHVSDGLLGVLFALQAVAMGVATLAGPAVAARLGRVRTVVLTQVLSIPFLAVLGFVPSLSLASIAFLARAGLMNMGHPLYSAFAMDRVDEARRGTANALLIMSSQGSRAVSSWLAGLLQQGPGFSPIFALTITCYLAASGLTHRFFSRRAEPDRG